MKKRLLILGSLNEFVQLIETAKARGIYTIVVDGYEDSPGKQHADKAYNIPPGNIDEIAALCVHEKVDGIITSFSDYLFECMVKIADKAGLKCYFSPDKLSLYRNKKEMKKMFNDLDIATPKFTTLKKDFPDEALAGFTFPIVTKPLDKYGSRGVLVLNSVKDIRDLFDEICETSEIKEILVEEYHDGYEFNMMTWILDGQVQVLSIADREKTSIGTRDIPISSRNVYPSRLIASVYEEAKAVLQKVADYTEQKEGILSMQFFWKPDKPVSVCEVAGRFFGYEHELVEYCCGMAVEELLLDYIYDETGLRSKLASHSPYFSKCCATLYFHGKPDMTVDDQTKCEELAATPHINAHLKEYLPFYKKGETIIPHGKNPYAARYYLTADTRPEMDLLTREIFDSISILSPEGEEVLYRNRMPVYPDEPFMKTDSESSCK